jgi:outer membrane protein assembly factor BamB
MRRWSVVVVLVGLVLTLVAGVRARDRRNDPGPAPAPTAAEAPAPAAPAVDPDPEAAARAAEDLAWARALNDPKFPIGREWRQGHVSPRELGRDRVTRSAGRFEVRLPSGAPITTPAVHQGKVLVSGGFHGKEFYAVDARTGAAIWGRDLDDDGPSAPACADGICVFNTESCTIFALKADTGEPLWSWWMGDPMLSAPAIAGGVVFTSYPNAAASRHPEASHVLAALDLRTGEPRWQRWLDGDVLSAPVIDGDQVLVTTFAGTVLTLGRSDGAIRAATRSRATSAPTVVDGKLFWSARSEQQGDSAKESIVRAARSLTTEARVAEKEAPYLDAKVQSASGYASQGAQLDASNGFGGGAPSTAKAEAAQANVGQGTVSRLQSFQGSRIASDGRSNYAAMGDEVVATDPKTGEERWRHKVAGDLAQAGGSLVASPAVAGGRLVVGTLEGEVLVLDRDKGTVLRRIAIGAPIRSQVVVQDGWVYAGTEDGRLVGVDTGDPTLTGWAMWGGDAARTASAR